MTEIASVYDEVAPAYDSMYGDRQSQIEDAMMTLRLGQALEKTPEDSLVVDLGCGTGHALSLMPEMSDRYVGIDISGQMIQQARARFPEGVFVRDDFCHALNGAWSLPQVGLFVSLFTCLNHISAIERGHLWGYVADRLIPGGRVLFMFGTKHRPASPDYLFRGREDVPFDPSDAREIRGFARMAGLRLKSMNGMTSPRFRGKPVLCMIDAYTRGVVRPDNFDFIVAEAVKDG